MSLVLTIQSQFDLSPDEFHRNQRNSYIGQLHKVIAQKIMLETLQANYRQTSRPHLQMNIVLSQHCQFMSVQVIEQSKGRPLLVMTYKYDCLEFIYFHTETELRAGKNCGQFLKDIYGNENMKSTTQIKKLNACNIGSNV